jgi:DNA repair protein RecO (recombination protein O)
VLTKDTAICIRAIDYSETSQIVTFFTRATGKISAIAKGSKRPKSAFDGPIEIFSHGKIVFSDSNKERLATLTEFEQQPTQYAIRNTRYDISLFALNCQLFGAELISSLTHDYDPHPDLFDSFLQFLQNISESQVTSHELSLLILFQLTLLKEIGLQPILNYCVNCKTTFEHRATSNEFYFSSSANGLICGDCEGSFPDKMRLTKNAANCLANVKLIAESQEKTLNEIEKVLIYHFTELLGKPPKMAKHILGTRLSS